MYLLMYNMYLKNNLNYVTDSDSSISSNVYNLSLMTIDNTCTVHLMTFTFTELVSHNPQSH